MRGKGGSLIHGNKANPETNAPSERDTHSRSAHDCPGNSTAEVQVDSGSEKNAELEKLDNLRTTSSSASPCSSDQGGGVDDRTVVAFEENDKSSPYNWSRPKKLYVVITGMLMVLNSTMGSSIPAGATGTIEKYFDVHEPELLVLPVSIYLIGYILGPLIFAPLSEQYGRKIVMICTFTMFTAFVLACALAPNFASLIIFRLWAGIGASTPVSVIGGIYADLYSTPRARGVAITCFMAGTTWGPLLGPSISGFISVGVSWRWVYWVELILAGATWPFLLLFPETYGPVLLRRKAKRLRKETGNPKIVAPSELEKQDLRQLVVVVLTRPVRMFLFEAIVLFSCLYLSLAYGIFYIFIQAFDLIFGETYGFNPGQVGLCFLPIGVGSVLAACIYLYWEAIGLFWLGWTARPDVHWIVPVLSAFPFGVGFLLIFMALINYVVDAYEVFAASAMGATSASRSIFGVVLPFAAKPLFTTLGVNWGCTLLGILSAIMCLVPFAFLRFGSKIRERSAFCQELKKKKADDEEKQRRLWERQRRDRDIADDLEKQS